MTKEEIRQQLEIVLENHLSDLDLSIGSCKATDRVSAILELARIVFDKKKLDESI